MHLKSETITEKSKLCWNTDLRRRVQVVAASGRLEGLERGNVEAGRKRMNKNNTCLTSVKGRHEKSRRFHVTRIIHSRTQNRMAMPVGGGRHTLFCSCRSKKKLSVSFLVCLSVQCPSSVMPLPHE
ncbi:hypothetical protein BS78_04G325600 [Paspalum vaginatum]|nr:hypothetical protein BS78_04G325600 [Paspalum vaginatum]